MKKELLLATALASTVGIAGFAEAASSSFSGHVRTGAAFDGRCAETHYRECCTDYRRVFCPGEGKRGPMVLAPETA